MEQEKYRYYSTQRPIGPGTCPKGPVEVVHYEGRIPVAGETFSAWGVLAYDHGCTFAVCRIQDARFDGASLYASEFHSCTVSHTTFFHAVLADTHFRDCSMEWASFQRARLARCNFLDCMLDSVNFLASTLDGCAVGRCQAHNIRCLNQAVVTMGGGTAEECRENRAAIFRALRVPEPREKDRQPGPER